jgi:hypothetical protein
MSGIFRIEGLAMRRASGGIGTSAASAMLATVAVIAGMGAIGCNRPASPPAESAVAAEPAAQSAPLAPTVPTTPLAPMAPMAPMAPGTAGTGAPAAPHGAGAGEKALSSEGATVTTASFRFDLPAAWRREQPSSGMRLAQAVVPGADGPGELAVFHFGAGQGGTVESNFERWVGQVERAKGVEPERGSFTLPGFEISWIEARGTLLPSGMGSGPSTPQPGFALLGAVVEGEGGPWFFKLTGPEKTLGAERDAFLALLRGIRRPQ